MSSFNATRLVSGSGSDNPRDPRRFRSRNQRAAARLREDKSGAAIVEFAMAIMPVLMLFFGMVQWSICAYVHLIVKHAAYISARCQAVVNPGMPDAKIGDNDCQDAVMALFAHVQGVNLADFTISPTLAGPTEEKIDTVKVVLNYRCSIPLGNVLACSSSRIQVFTETSAFPNQGSTYQKVWPGT